MSGRDPPKRGAATSCQASFHLDIFFFCHTQRLYQCQLSLFLPSLLVSVAFSLWRILFRNIFSKGLCQTYFLCQACLAQSVEQMDFDLKVEGSTPPQVMSLSFLLAFACTEKRFSLFFFLSLSLSFSLCLSVSVSPLCTYVISLRSWVVVLT